MGIKASKKADITAPPQKDKKLKRKKSKKEAAAAVINGDTGIEEVSIQSEREDFGQALAVSLFNYLRKKVYKVMGYYRVEANRDSLHRKLRLLGILSL
ncbi:hypothetical protein TNCV_2012061 [Trichonephila clavipes]|nr:hypothetical protein TNCV_2012061 [Trichonephila clavipes]